MRWISRGLIPLGVAGVLALPFSLVGLPSAAAQTASGGETPVTAPAPAVPPGALASVAALEAQDLATVNAERAAAGVAPVQSQSWAASLAETHSQQMAAAETIDHDLSGFMAEGHSVLGATFLGENVAMDSTLAAADQLLFSDPPHRAILMDARYNYVGIGVAYDARNWVYLTENFAEVPGAGAPRVTVQQVPGAPAAAHLPAPKPAAVTAPAPVRTAPVPVATVAVPKIAVPTVPAAAAAPPAAAHLAAAKPVSHRSPLPGLGLMMGVVLTILAAAAATLLGRQRTLAARARGQWRPTATPAPVPVWRQSR